MLHAKGPLVTVDVTERRVESEDIDRLLEEFIGGRGIATKLAHDRIPYDADPFGAENRLYLSTGPLQMSRMSFTGRMNLTSLSPLTDGLLSTNAGGYLSRNFVGTGNSVIELTGMSDTLLAVHISDEGVEFEEVPELKEATVPEVTEYMNDQRGLESENLVTIGPAGENQVRYASVMTYDSRAFGRGGLGAVMGAKNVKCISFTGSSEPPIDIDPDIQSEIHREAATADDMMKRHGTTAGTGFVNDNFSLPTKYFQEYSFAGADKISEHALEEKKYSKEACSVCAFACKLPTRDEETGLETEGPEYETVFSFGSNPKIDDIVDVMKSNELCDTLGLDTISAGNTISAYLAANDEFGNADLVHQLVEKIAYREGVGDLLAEGIDRCHGELGVPNYTVKGLDFSAHDGRVLHGTALSYAVANRGGDHMYSTIHHLGYSGELDPEGLDGKPEILVREENINAVRDSGVVCEFSSRGYLGPEGYEALFRTDLDSLLKLGSKVVDLERHFFNQRGIDRDDDSLPYEIPGLESALDEYYELRGWTDEGRVPESKMQKLLV
ncbi:aldehyde ferredoxin oxidoreductase C-terminal domain-containing protein [Haloferax profundi]|uniref:Aldehyde ferredoxin oxidoreductase n=1 Tax=Haloferax profundi TaxID=1544718 RepID=A0A0W1RFI1_9EURY|nr:aldehyde ferredoxin oxidoreductase C-terminal domain-containing protein [Haloferax profundi]KTG12226.1 aldehyde ferredoxin oxidoreductase [Haloferax profundi]